jgi:hypothetical protein
MHLGETFPVPTAPIEELTPRLWKQHFAANPLRSEIHDFPV